MVGAFSQKILLTSDPKEGNILALSLGPIKGGLFSKNYVCISDFII